MPLKTRITDVRHNAETGCFEAYVTLIDGTDSFTYAVSCPAPIDAETGQITAALTAKARAQHQPSSCSLVRKRVAEAIPEDTRDVVRRVLLGQPDYLGQILARPSGGAMRGF